MSTTSAPPPLDLAARPRDPRATPAMRQYARFKAQHPECVLFFRMGDFYEMFDQDAVLAHKALGITLTQRTEGVPMAGVPYHAVEGYLRRMIAQGYRVAVCEQMQDPDEATGVIERAVTRVITPGTIVDEGLLDEAAPNAVAAIAFLESGDEAPAVLAICELSTGTFHVHDLPPGRAADELARLAPRELLYVETADGAAPRRVTSAASTCAAALSARPAWTFRAADALDCLKRHYGVATLAGFGLADDDPAVAPAGALLRYLQETQAPDDERSGLTKHPRSALAHLAPPKREAVDACMSLDAATIRSLEIERTMRSGESEGSLLAVLQRCATPMGKRLVRRWLCFPLRQRDPIEARQGAVAALLADRRLASELGDSIDGVQDVARIAARISMGRASPRDLVALGRSVIALKRLQLLLGPVPALAVQQGALQGVSSALNPIAASIIERCVDAPPAHLREGGLFRDGVDAELDEAKSLQRDGSAWLAAYQKRLVEQTGISSLKVGYNRVFGYYIEITHANAEKVPDTFSRKQTLKNAERYITPELKEFEDKVMSAEARAIEREQVLFDRLCAQAAAVHRELSLYAAAVAELDVLLNFAEAASRFNYVRPTIVDEPVLDIREGRHPVLDRTLGERFVPNDCQLSAISHRPSADSPQNSALRTQNCGSSLALITGPNMAGKSTFIRQTALIVLLAHTGCFVPAESATIGLTDRIFTRIGAADELHAGHSTFMVEMTETANILHHASPRSLVILDEIGRGTSTLDGLSLAWAIAETLAARGCRTLFATHYHELTALAERLPNVSNLHVSVREWGEQIIFLYRILPGRTDRSYGIHVAKIAGLPPQTIRRASELLETLAVQTESPALAELKPRTPAAGAQLGLFTEYLEHPVVGELRAMNLDGVTPMQAFDALRKLKDQLT